MIGSSYDRTIYGFEIETSPEQDALLIDKLNRQPNPSAITLSRETVPILCARSSTFITRTRCIAV